MALFTLMSIKTAEFDFGSDAVKYLRFYAGTNIISVGVAFEVTLANSIIVAGSQLIAVTVKSYAGTAIRRVGR